jgi:hypothetical protein
MCKIKLEEVGFIGGIRAPQDKGTHGPEPHKARFQGHSFFEMSTSWFTLDINGFATKQVGFYNSFKN